MRTKNQSDSGESLLERLKESLGSAVSGYTDAELSQLKRDIDVVAELLLDLYLAKRREREERHRRPPPLTTDTGALRCQ